MKISEIVLCAKGGGGTTVVSGGGGGSGQVSYPAYMQAFHGAFLNANAGDNPTYSIVDAMNAAYGSSPWTSAAAFNPTTLIAASTAAVTAFNAIVDALDHKADWDLAINKAIDIDTDVLDDSYVADTLAAFNAAINALDWEDDWEAAMATAKAYIDDSLINDTFLNAEVASFTDLQDDERDDIIIPRFKDGMRNINAVMSSSFVIGEALIEARGARDVAKFTSVLKLEQNKQRNDMIIAGAHKMLENLLDILKLKSRAGELEGNLRNAYEMKRLDMIMGSTDLMLKNYMSRVDFERQVAHYTIECNRIAIVAQKEQTDQNYLFDEADAKWNLETFQYGANVLAAIGGGTASPGGGNREVGSTASVIGGALSGAAAGAMAGSMIGGPGMGTAIGAGIGGLLGAFGLF